MMRNRVLILLGGMLMFCACSTKTSVQVPRDPVIKFSYGSLVWTDNAYSFLPTFQTVAYPADTLLPGHLYTRYSLQATGEDSKGSPLQLEISFDASDATQLVGTYSTAYTVNNGLGHAQLFDLDGNNLSDYGMCPNDTASFFRVQRQSPAERLIAGSFQLQLCNARDSSQKISITNGIFTDIHY